MKSSSTSRYEQSFQSLLADRSDLQYPMSYLKVNPNTGKIQKRWWMHIVAIFTVPWILKLFFRFEVVGSEYLPKRGPVVIMSNHLSHIDSIMIGAAAILAGRFEPFFWMGDDKLYKMPLFYPFLRGMNTFSVKKGTKQISAVKLNIQLVNEGHGIVYYPEGARSKDGNIQPGKLGAGWIVHTVKAPIIPCFLFNADKAMPVGRGFKIGRGPRSTRIKVKFGSPIDLREYRQLPVGKETSQKVTDKIMDVIKRLGGIT